MFKPLYEYIMPSSSSSSLAYPLSSTVSLYSVDFAQHLVFSTLKKLRLGRLTVLVKGSQEVYEFGCTSASKTDMHATLTIINQASFFWGIILFSALGLGESFMKGDFVVDNIQAFLMILANNRDYLDDGKTILPAGLNAIVNNVFTRRISNSLLNSLGNISAHYDLGNDMFKAFLDETMMYSCPIWLNETESLESAQRRKIHAMLDLASIQVGDRVLEIGTGWGSLAIEAAKRSQCQVITITLSKEQQHLAQTRIEKEGLSHLITVLLQDYRTLDPNVYQFDRIVSVEMIEAVGPEFLSTFFSVCNKLLKPNGVLAMQAITMPESRYESYCNKTDFIQKHIFPGGHCPSFSALVKATEEGARGQLAVDQVDNIGPHYAKALRLWCEKFEETFDEFASSSGMRDIYNDEFKRKWIWYFRYSELGFRTRTLGVLQIRFSRPNNSSLLKNVPF